MIAQIANMPRSARDTQATPPFWLWALLPLLLAAILAIPLLNVDGYNGDETWHLDSAGIMLDEPRHLTEVWNKTAPRVAPGWPVLIASWARFAGWSELVINSLGTFAGLLTIALVYRAGRDIYSPAAGVIAAALLTTSVFHLAYILRAGPYAGVACFTALVIWSYWKSAIASRPAGKRAEAGLLAGSAGLLLTHYLSALMLPLLGLFHLLFVPKGKRWWKTVFIFALAALAGVLQVPHIQSGLAYTVNEDLGSEIHSVPSLLYLLLSGLTNGIFHISTPAEEVLAFGLFLFLAASFVWHLRSGGTGSAFWYPGVLFVSFLALIIITNEILRVIGHTHERYLMPLWPLGAVLAGATLARLRRRYRPWVIGFLTLWLGLGTWLISATTWRYELGHFFRTDIHHVAAAARDHVAEQDGLVVRLDQSWRGIRQDTWLVQMGKMKFDFDVYLSGRDDILSSVLAARASHPYVWLLRHQQQIAHSSIEAFEAGTIICERVLDKWGYKLERYTGTEARCPHDTLRLEYEHGVSLGGTISNLGHKVLQMEVHLFSNDAQLLAHYSLALHVIDPRSGRRVAQRDVGVGPGSFVPVRSDIDIGALPAGAWEVHVALYDWQTGERLSARNPETGEVSDMHVLHRFHIN